MEEIWRVIEEAPNYEVSNLGNVRNNKLHKPMKPFTNNSGYYQVVLRNNGKSLYRLVHRLVAIAFLDNPYDYTEVNHKDFDKANNSVENLEWVNHHMNMKYNRLRTDDVERLINMVLKDVSQVVRNNIKRYVIEDAYNK